MKLVDASFETNERREEYFALINMIGYAASIAKSLGAVSAAMQIESARKSLVSDLENEFAGTVTKEGITRIANVRAGHC